MSKAVDEILNSILEEFRAGRGRIGSQSAVSAIELLPATLGKRAAAGKNRQTQVLSVFEGVCPNLNPQVS